MPVLFTPLALQDSYNVPATLSGGWGRERRGCSQRTHIDIFDWACVPSSDFLTPDILDEQLKFSAASEA